MTRKMHYLVAATDGKAPTCLTSIYAANFEEAWREAMQWHERECPELPTLSVVAQPQGFQAGFTRLPGYIDDEEELELVNQGMFQEYVSRKREDSDGLATAANDKE